jgi:SAM-dependent methyltransferase
MHEILSRLPAGSTVLDLGSGSGSFEMANGGPTVVRADLLVPDRRNGNFVVCRASQLPFAAGSFRAAILNHSLEHFDDLPGSLGEIARVLGQSALLYIAVPDASTFTDRTYRWLAHGGGHVNPFSDPFALRRMIAAETGLKDAGTRVLCTSLSFLNRHNIVSRPQRKLLLFCNGHEAFLRMFTFALKCLDRTFQTRTSVYGWAFYFGDLGAVDLVTWSNVCIRCGSGHRSSLLKNSGRVTRRWILPSAYLCPQCGARNFFTDDEDFRRLG